MRYFLVFLVLLSLSYADNLSARLENLIKTRQDRPVVFLNYNPFQIVKTEKKTTDRYTPSTRQKKAEPLDFVTVINHQAFVNGRWLKVGEKIAGYKLEKIDSDTIIVSKNGVKTTLGLGVKQNILKVRENKHEN
jgi:hypothetical protein